MTSRLSLAVLGLALAAFMVPASTAGAKDDAAKLKKAREKVRAKYEVKKAGYAFPDLGYWIDAAKLEDSRWSVSTKGKSHEKGLMLRVKWSNEASAAAGMNIDVIIQKFIYYKQNGNTRTPFSLPFENYGESVRCDDLEGLLVGFFQDWKRSAKDVIEKESVEAKKARGAGKVVELYSACVGTDKDSGNRERREWYGWADGKRISSYIVEVRYGPALLGKEGLLAKGKELVKNIAPIKDKVKWR